MPAAKKSKPKSTGGANGPVTRSRIKESHDKESSTVDVTTYTTLNGVDGNRPIQVVSKRPLKSDPKHYADLEKRFEKIEAKRQHKDSDEDETDDGSSVVQGILIY